MFRPLIPILCAAFATNCSRQQGLKKAKCESLDRYGCTRAPHCTLEHTGSGHPSRHYRCRPARGKCEKGVRQADFMGGPGYGSRDWRKEKKRIAAGAKRCTHRPGCVLTVGVCYCQCKGYGETRVPDKNAPACACACGGGPPPRCVDVGRHMGVLKRICALPEAGPKASVVAWRRAGGQIGALELHTVREGGRSPAALHFDPKGRIFLRSPAGAGRDSPEMKAYTKKRKKLAEGFSSTDTIRCSGVFGIR